MSAATGARMLEAVDVAATFKIRSGWFDAGLLNAVDGVSVHLDTGETVAVVGETGSGKSTLARLLVGMLPPTRGSVSYRGRPLPRMSPSERSEFRRDVQLVFQNPSRALNPHMTAAESVERPLIANRLGTRAERHARVEELFELVGLPRQAMDRRPHELSGGQRQRVSIARAMSTRPKIVVLDEPTSSLDVSIQAMILNLLADLQAAQDVSYVLISHDMRVVQQVSNRVYVMFGGQIVEAAPTAQLFAAASHPYTLALLESIPTFGRPARATPAAADEASLGRGGCRYTARCPFAAQICRDVAPPLAAAGDDHQAACHFISEVAVSAQQLHQRRQ